LFLTAARIEDFAAAGGCELLVEMLVAALNKPTEYTSSPRIVAILARLIPFTMHYNVALISSTQLACAK
jgi:hypothetical protein